MSPVRKILLVDDHELVRIGVKTAYPEILDLSIDWLEAIGLNDAIDLFRRNGDIDLVLLDLNLADCKGLQGLRLFLQAHPTARVAVFSGTQDEFVIGQARALGAIGYLGKGAPSHQIRSTLLALLNQPAVTRADIRGRVTPSAFFPRVPASGMLDRAAELGPRHLEILELVLSGCTNQEISTSTALSLGTVKNYVSSLLLALDVRSRSHLISLFR